MARNYVRETQEVRNLNKEIIKGEDFIKKQEGAAKKLLATIAGVNDELSKSGNFSEKNHRGDDWGKYYPIKYQVIKLDGLSQLLNKLKFKIVY